MAEEKQISKHVFVSLLKMDKSNKSKVAEINGDFGEKLAHHKEHSNLDLPAFKFIAKMNRMEEQKRNALWASLLFLKDLADETVWAESHVGDLADMAGEADDEADEEQPDPDAVAAEANAEAIRSGISELPEEGEEAPVKPKRAPRPRKPAAGSVSGSYRVN